VGIKIFTNEKNFDEREKLEIRHIKKIFTSVKPSRNSFLNNKRFLLQNSELSLILSKKN